MKNFLYPHLMIFFFSTTIMAMEKSSDSITSSASDEIEHLRTVASSANISLLRRKFGSQKQISLLQLLHAASDSFTYKTQAQDAPATSVQKFEELLSGITVSPQDNSIDIDVFINGMQKK